MPELQPRGETGANGASPAVEIRSLSKTLGRGVRVLDGLNLSVGRGEVVGLTGPNGAGKSTVLKVLLGLVRPSSGHAFLFGEPAGPGAAVLGRVGAMVDGPGFLPYLSGRANLAMAQRTNPAHISVADIDAASAASGLGSALQRPFRTYSHGMRYRLGLAMAMMGQPDLLLLDEPTTGLDPAHVEEIVQALEDRAARGVSMLVASHDLGFLEEVCTRIGFLVGGRVQRCGTMDEVRAGAGSIEAAYRLAVSAT